MRVSGISQRGYRSTTWPELDGTRLDSFDLLSNYSAGYRYDGFGLCFISEERG